MLASLFAAGAVTVLGMHRAKFAVRVVAGYLHGKGRSVQFDVQRGEAAFAPVDPANGQHTSELFPLTADIGDGGKPEPHHRVYMSATLVDVADSTSKGH